MYQVKMLTYILAYVMFLCFTALHCIYCHPQSRQIDRQKDTQTEREEAQTGGMLMDLSEWQQKQRESFSEVYLKVLTPVCCS